MNKQAKSNINFVLEEHNKNRRKYFYFLKKNAKHFIKIEKQKFKENIISNCPIYEL